VPVSVESFARLGAPTYALLCRVANVAADGGGVSNAAFIESAQQEMIVTLAKGNGRVLRTHFLWVAQASGRAYLRELPVQGWLRWSVWNVSQASAGCMSLVCVLAGPGFLL
jgi:hypothetical protein